MRNRSTPPTQRRVRVVFLGVLAVLLATTCKAGAQGYPRIWSQAFPANHPPQYDSCAMTFDAARNVVVLFGGGSFDTQGYYGTTWTWNGQDWSLASFAGPGPRAEAKMVYDSRRAVCVLFGGVQPGQSEALQDTWEWDGSTWQLRATNGPPASEEYGLAFDKARGRVVLFGGEPCGLDCGANSPYTWEWDGQQWFLADTNGPPRRYLCALAYDEAHAVVVLFGGYDPGANNTIYNDTWTWNGTTWTQLAVSGPGARFGHEMVYDAERKTVVLFGGATEDTGTWEWNGSQWSLRSSFDLSSRWDHAMAYDTARNEVVLYGGLVGRGIDHYQTWRLHLKETWVDFAWLGFPILPETGEFNTPFNTLAEGVTAAMEGSVVKIKTGSRNESIVINKHLHLQAYAGPATIGR